MQEFISKQLDLKGEMKKNNTEKPPQASLMISKDLEYPSTGSFNSSSNTSFEAC